LAYNFKYFINLRTLKLGWHCLVATPWLRSWWQPYSDCRLQTSAGIRDWAQSMGTPIRKFKLTNTIFNNHDNSVYIGNLHTVSTDNPVIMFIFLIHPLVLCWETIPTEMRSWNLHSYITFYHNVLGGQKILCPHHKLDPCIWDTV